MTTTTEVTTTALDNPAEAVIGIDFAEAGALYPDWRGINYDPNLTVKEVAATIRTHLRRAVKAEKLGTATKVSVRYDSYSGGSAIDVTITVPKVKVTADTPGAQEMEDRWGEKHWVVKREDDHSAGIYPDDVIEPGAREAKAKVERFVATFNRNRSNTQIDYFDRRFYGSVTLRNEDGGWE